MMYDYKKVKFDKPLCNWITGMMNFIDTKEEAFEFVGVLKKHIELYQKEQENKNER